MEDNMKKKHVSLLLAAAMAASVISGCGSSANNRTAETTKQKELQRRQRLQERQKPQQRQWKTQRKTRQMRLSSRLRVTLYREAETLTTVGKALMYGKLSQQTTAV